MYFELYQSKVQAFFLNTFSEKKVWKNSISVKSKDLGVLSYELKVFTIGYHLPGAKILHILEQSPVQSARNAGTGAPIRKIQSF